MTIKELIEKMKNEMYNGVFGAVEDWISDITKLKNSDLDFLIKQGELKEVYNKINGFLWGLYATNFITIQQKETLFKELNNLCFGKEV